MSNTKSSDEFVELEHGGGGEKSSELIAEIRKILNVETKWTNTGDDSAVLNMLSLRGAKRRGNLVDVGNIPGLPRSLQSLAMTDFNLVFTTDSFIVNPLFFPGGDIGKIAMCGTINDLAVMGAKPLGIGLSLVIEEGFPKKDLFQIINSINNVSKQTGVPIVTGDTKVMERGKIDKIEITTSGIGLADKIINNGGAKAGDIIISSGDLGEHTVALLATRFNYQTKIKSDSKPLNKELSAVGKYLHACKDPTRGGLAANIIEIADKSRVKIILDENLLPFKKETTAISELLGIDVLSFASEGRFIASVAPKNVKKVLQILRKFNKEVKIIGEVQRGKGVYLKTSLGSLRPIEMPKGKLVPRIC